MQRITGRALRSLWLTGLLIAGLTIPVSADPLSWPPNWAPYNGAPVPPGTTVPVEYYGFTVSDDFSDGAEGQSFISVPVPAIQPQCYGIDDPACTQLAPQYGWWGNLVLPPCSVADAGADCVGGLTVERNGVRRTARLIRELQGWRWRTDPQKRIPKAGTRSIWSNPFSDDPAAGFLVTVSGGLVQEGTRVAPRFRFGGLFSATIVPYREVATAGLQGPVQDELTDPDGTVRTVRRGAISSSCVWVEDGLCGAKAEFPDDIRLSLAMRLPRDVTGWLSGRLEAPAITVVPGDRQNLLTVEAKPANVGRVAGVIPASAASPELVNWANTKYNFPPGMRLQVVGGRNSSESSIGSLKLFAKYLDDTLAGMEQVWMVGRMATTGPMSSCLGDSSRLVGLVTTNAPVFQAGPPSFSSTEQTLDYYVAGLHFRPDKTVFQGTYDLLLRSDAARCLYGFSAAPVKATISVTGSDATLKTAVTTFNESGGWLRFSASGFGFSEPTIRVRLQQASAPAPTSANSDRAKPVIILKLSFSKLVVGKPVVQSPSTLKTNMNAAADISSVTPSICSVKPGRKGPVVTGLNVGTCRLKAYAAGMAGKFPSATKYYSVPVIAA